MALHFRRLVSIVLAEYLSQLKNKSLNEITLVQFDDFLTSLQKPRRKISNLIRAVLNILCCRSDVDDAAQNVIANWIRRKDPLTSVK